MSSDRPSSSKNTRASRGRGASAPRGLALPPRSAMSNNPPPQTSTPTSFQSEAPVMPPYRSSQSATHPMSDPDPMAWEQSRGNTPGMQAQQNYSMQWSSDISPSAFDPMSSKWPDEQLSWEGQSPLPMLEDFGMPSTMTPALQQSGWAFTPGDQHLYPSTQPTSTDHNDSAKEPLPDFGYRPSSSRFAGVKPIDSVWLRRHLMSCLEPSHDAVGALRRSSRDISVEIFRSLSSDET